MLQLWLLTEQMVLEVRVQYNMLEVAVPVQGLCGPAGYSRGHRVCWTLERMSSIQGTLSS